MQYPNLITLLDDAAPNELTILRTKHPEARKLLSAGRELGDGDPTPQEATSERESRRAALIDLIQVSSSRLQIPLNELAKSVREKMQSVSRMKFFGALVASLAGGMGAVLSFFALGDKAIAMVGSVFAMLGGATGLFADYFEKAPSGIRIAGVDEYGKLIAMVGDVEMIQAKISRNPVQPIPIEQLNEMLEKLDNYSLQVIRLKHA